MKKNFAFTLAEIMIVLVVIGVLTAVLLPAARNIMPDENVVKFKKAHNTLTSAVREVVTVDKYYRDGMLNQKQPSGTTDSEYFCNTLADIMNVRTSNCGNSANGTNTLASNGNFDNACATKGPVITTADGVQFYLPNKTGQFDATTKTGGFLSQYKVVCIDIDGDGSVAPYGYGVRVDGKVAVGSRAQTELNKSIQGGE